MCAVIDPGTLLRKIDDAIHARTGKRLGLRPGVPEAQLRAAEATLGRPLPEDVARIYRAHDGAATSMGWLGAAGAWLSLEELVAQWQQEADLAGRYGEEGGEIDIASE